MRVAFQGETGAFGELAASEYFGADATLVAVPGFNDVFTAVIDRHVHQGIIPIENSQAGSIHQNYDLLLEHDLYIVGEIFLRVSHFLIARPGVSRRRIRRVFSHPQALAQCRHYLERFPHLEIVPVSNTATGVAKIRNEGLDDAAAIASRQAAMYYEMAILARNIEDNPTNTTRFLVLGRRPLAQKKYTETMKSSIVFSTRNIPGALFKALSVFALRDIDLLKIESRPVHGRHFEYLFYLDFAGNSSAMAQKNAIHHLQEIAHSVRFLGSYPVGALAHPRYQQRKAGK